MKLAKKTGILLLLIFSTGFLTSCNNNKDPAAPDHIVIVLEENHSYDQIVGSPEAPYINSLIQQGLLFKDSHGLLHPSQPNYLALFSGQIQGVKGDICLEDSTPFTTPNLGNELIKKGFSFAGYSETMPTIGFTGCGFSEGGFTYARKHSPWVNWQGDSPTGLPDSANLTFRDFPTDFSKLPTVAFVIPNLTNDMHDGEVKTGDQWLKEHMEEYIQWAKKNNSLFILTFDEDDFTEANHITTIFVGAGIKSGQVDSTNINHYNVLRTIENFYKLPNSGAATEKHIAGVWNVPGR